MIKQPANQTRRRGARGEGARAKSAVASVLVVDDDPFVRQALVEMLTGDGFATIEVTDGAVAMKLLEGGLRPSLILLDLMMREMDARAFRALQARDPELRSIPTVVLTGSRVDLAALSRELGGVLVMAKPVGYADLLALVGRYCARAA